jgi:hypothetical protein
VSECLKVVDTRRTYNAFLVACSTGTFPATVVIATTRTSGVRNAMMIATASSEAVSVSIRNRRGIRTAYHRNVIFHEMIFTSGDSLSP